MDRSDDRLLAWADQIIRNTWRGSRVARSALLRGDLSTRRFWRITVDGGSAPSSAILVDLGPDELPGYVRALRLVCEPLTEPPWLTVHRFLTTLGVPVPALYATDRQHRAMLIEDVGETSLVDAVRRQPSETAELYRLAVDLLLVFHVKGTRALPANLLPATIAYDERLFRWEFKEFLELGCATLGADASALLPELDALAGELGRLPRVFSHRDFHGQNLFVTRHTPAATLRVLDFQDALMAPAAQDLAVLLTTRDMAATMSPALEQRLLDFYYAGLTRLGAVTLRAEAFSRSYHLCVLQHAIKMMGRFLMFERSGKSGYAIFVPRAVDQARRILGGPCATGFPALARAFDASQPESR
ncbi:MAG: phosphotransferase [Deltaproteobacteria bacterium]|nr:phosphotransferase [Deltaproteobacteria bacterium]